MPFPFDATLKDIVRTHASEYAAVFGCTNRPVRLLNVDLSTVSAASDVVLGIGEPLEEILDINFQSGPDCVLSPRTEMYRAILHHEYHVPVRSLIVLLRPAADHAHLSGELSYGEAANGVQCHYEVLRLWKLSPDAMFRFGPGLFPVATLCQVSDEQALVDGITKIVREMESRLAALNDDAQTLRILKAAYVLCGVRLDHQERRKVFQELAMVQKLTAWDEELLNLLRKTRGILLRLGTKKFGPAPEHVHAAIDAVDDPDRVDRLIAAVLDCASWDELLATR